MGLHKKSPNMSTTLCVVFDPHCRSLINVHHWPLQRSLVAHARITHTAHSYRLLFARTVVVVIVVVILANKMATLG